MSESREYVIVEAKALPDIFVKVLEAKRLMDSGKAKTVQEAAAAMGISRSAFYKYKDQVFSFYESTRSRNVIIAMNLDNIAGLLSQVLDTIAKSGANILTINQTIPINNIANVTITMETGNGDVNELFEQIAGVPGVQGFKILGRE